MDPWWVGLRHLSVQSLTDVIEIIHAEFYSMCRAGSTVHRFFSLWVGGLGGRPLAPVLEDLSSLLASQQVEGWIGSSHR